MTEYGLSTEWYSKFGWQEEEGPDEGGELGQDSQDLYKQGGRGGHCANNCVNNCVNKHLLVAYYVCVRGQEEARWKYIYSRILTLNSQCAGRISHTWKIIGKMKWNNSPSRIRGIHKKKVCAEILITALFVKVKTWTQHNPAIRDC